MRSPATRNTLWDGNPYRQNIINPSWNFDRLVTVLLPEGLPTRTPKTIFDASHATHSCMVLRLAVPVDVSGRLAYTVASMSLEYPPIPTSPKTFEKWRGQLPPTEQRLRRSISCKLCDGGKELTESSRRSKPLDDLVGQSTGLGPIRTAKHFVELTCRRRRMSYNSLVFYYTKLLHPISNLVIVFCDAPMLS